MKVRKTLYISLLTLLLYVAMSTNTYAGGRGYYSGGYHDTTPSGGEMVVDAVIARPLGIVATVVGTAVYTVSLPFSLAGGNESDARRNLVYSPAVYTFNRPLGKF